MIADSMLRVVPVNSRTRGGPAVWPNHRKNTTASYWMSLSESGRVGISASKLVKKPGSSV